MATLSVQELDDGIYVAGQLQASDILDLANFGIVALICNRPDDEEAGQPAFAHIKQAAEACGMQVHYIPVVSGAIEPRHIADMAAALQQSPRPLLMYCRSGSRSKHLYHLAVRAISEKCDAVFG